MNGILDWRAEMDANLRRENDWLALAGLFWLQRGFNTFGSSPDCDIVLPAPAPRLLGAFEFDGARITLHVDVGQSVQLNGESLQSAAPLRTDRDGSPSCVEFGALRMIAIYRSNRVGVRLWDNSRSQRRDFPPRLWFPVSEQFCLPATYTPYPVPMKVSVPNVLGELEDDIMHGYVSFKFGGKSHRLEVSELDDGRLYIQFMDLTNGVQTYPSGRYHYTDAVTEDGRIILDFNKAYNPPCAFTDYATCTFAPKQNHLKIAVEAGELNQPSH